MHGNVLMLGNDHQSYDLTLIGNAAPTVCEQATSRIALHHMS